MLTITLLGTGGPVPDPHRAGPAMLVSAGSERYLVDSGRGVLMRLAAASSGAAQTAARAGMGTLVLTHYFPPPSGDDASEYRARAAGHFAGAVEVEMAGSRALVGGRTTPTQPAPRWPANDRSFSGRLQVDGGAPT